MTWRIHRSESAAGLFMKSGKVNELGPELFQSFHEALSELEIEGQPLVLASDLKAFGAGLDLPALAKLDRSSLENFFKDLDHMLLRLLRYPAPVIAAVNGPALAGGAIVALCADTIIAHPEARMGLTESVVGVPFPALPEAIAALSLAPNRLREALVLGCVYTGSDLLQTGFAHRLSDDPVKSALEFNWPSPAAALAIKQDLVERIEVRARVNKHLDQEFFEHWFSEAGQNSVQAAIARFKK